MSDNIEWRHSDEWKCERSGFTVLVRRHGTKAYEMVDGKLQYTDVIENKWCLYAYIYPKHELFSKFDASSDINCDAARFFDWHGGCTFLRMHMSGDDCTSVQIGCDYNHLDDDRYLEMSNFDEASDSVFADAARLISVLEG